MKVSGTMKKWIAFLLFMIGMVLVLYLLANRSATPKTEATPTPTPLVAASGNIVIMSPSAESSVNQDFLIRGKARVFENVVSIRVRTKLTRKVLLQDTAMAYTPDTSQLGDFVYNAHLSSSDILRPNDIILLEVFQASAKDGREIDKVVIPLRFNPAMP